MTYVPAGRFEAAAAFPPIGDHEYVKGDVPPLTTTDAPPSVRPKQLTLSEVDDKVGALIFPRIPK